MRLTRVIYAFLEGFLFILRFPAEPNDSLILPTDGGMTSLSSCPGASTETRLLLEPVVVAVHHHGHSSLGEDKIPLIYQRERRAGGTSRRR